MLQTVCMSPDLLLSQNINENEICAYSPGHESPLPGETASPPNHFQQSPSLPDSGLTERNVASPETYRLPSAKPQEMSAPTDSGLSSEPPQKRYMGVRVKMPVRELLRKIRLSKGLDPGHSKEATLTKTAAKGSSGKTAEKRRAHPYTEKQLRQSKQSIGQTPKGLEDLDILVEVLQEDLNTSQSKAGCPEEFVEANTGSPEFGGHLKSFPLSSTEQDLSAISFFQFQLHREESLLRNISSDKLLAPDENGNRLLHKAVSQGRRALTYVLARRFASLNKIDEKDAEKRTALHLAAEKNQHLMVSDLISLGANVNEQDSLGKTPLHLCAENGYLRVLEVLKNFKENGMGVEVNLTDHYGLTPLHCAALSHTALLTESQKTDIRTDTGRFLKLRKDQILEGINCLLQMGGKPELQVLNSCQTTNPCLNILENTELMQLIQTHKNRRQNVFQEGYVFLDAPRRMPYVSPPSNISELFPFSSLGHFDIIPKGIS
ncbi:uncharacterized protein LOC112948716 [Nothoprocta perdicaria]|uniref:uncharacterized protein LOC112948716 n=1 Tax=Nothoprocta perdicaria TaxID=30464 RepID=UPI000E1C1651|nr:uncharacterized protein LOC112948716 [Nothoprocta perdicaria]